MIDATVAAQLWRWQRRARDFRMWSHFTGALPLSLLGAFAWRTWKRNAAPSNGHRPAATVIIPCKRRLPRAEAIVRAMLDQDFEGKTEYLFVTASKDQPAHAEIARILEQIADPRARLLVSDAAPKVCGEKILNQLHAVRHACAETKVLVFADQDVCVHSDWLRALIEPLRDDRIGATTTGFLECGGAGPMVRALQFMSLGGFYPFSLVYPVLFGPSFAMRRSDFERLDIPAIWNRRVSEEIPLSPFLKSRGLRIEFATEAVVASQDPVDLGGSLSAFGRWLFFVRLYDPTMWSLFFGATALKTYILGEMVSRKAWDVLAYALGCDLLYGLLSSLFYDRMYLRRLRPRFPELRVSVLHAALAWPLLLGFYWAAFLMSLRGRTVRWSGYDYEHLGPDDIRAVASPSGPGRGGVPGQ